MSQFSWSWRKGIAGLLTSRKRQPGSGRRLQPKVEALEDRLVQSATQLPTLAMLTPPPANWSSAPTMGGAANGAFEIKDFSFDIENPTTIGSATSGAGAGKIKFNEFTITKTTDSASPVFFKNCCAGAHYQKVVIGMRKAGGDPSTAGQPFLQYKFGTVFTTKIDWSSPGDEGPQESITFVYGTLEVQYVSQDPPDSYPKRRDSM
jgi:type VI secretion system secreted protein Hcp